MAPQGKRVLLLARDAVLAGVVLGDQPGTQVDVRIAVDECRVRGNLVATHRHQAHRLGAAGDHRAGEAGHDPFGTHRNRLEAGRAEAIYRHRGGADRHAGAETGDTRHVQSLLRLRHRAPEDHIVDFRGIQSRRTADRFGNDRGRHLVGSDGTQSAVGRLADRRASGRNDYRVWHEKSVRSSSRASPTSVVWPSNRWLARSIWTNSFGSCRRA